MSPIDFGPTPYELVLPGFDVNMLGSMMLTVWEIANKYSLIVILFLLVLAVSAVGWLYNFVTHRRSAHIDVSELWRDE